MSARRRALLLGAGGQVGGHLQRVLSGEWEVIAPARDAADLRDPLSLRVAVRSAGASLIVNAAAYTAVDAAESEPEIAAAVNADAPAVLAEEARQSGALLVHYSSDYVFDGSSFTPYREEDRTNPLSVYGRTKLAGDERIAASGARHLILRTSWVYDRRGRNFVRTMIALLRERDEVCVVNDQRGAPTSAAFIADATRTCVGRAIDAPTLDGLYHLTASGEATWFGVAERIRARLAGDPAARLARLVAISTNERPSAARRPLYSVLDCHRAMHLFGVRQLPWDALVDAELDVLLGTGPSST